MKIKQIYPKAYLSTCVVTVVTMLILKLVPFPSSFSPDEVYVYRQLGAWGCSAILFILGLLGLLFCRFSFPFQTLTFLLLISPIAALFSWAAYKPWHFIVGLPAINLIFAGVIIHTWRRTFGFS